MSEIFAAIHLNTRLAATASNGDGRCDLHLHLHQSLLFHNEQIDFLYVDFLVELGRVTGGLEQAGVDIARHCCVSTKTAVEIASYIYQRRIVLGNPPMLMKMSITMAAEDEGERDAARGEEVEVVVDGDGGPSWCRLFCKFAESCLCDVTSRDDYEIRFLFILF